MLKTVCKFESQAFTGLAFVIHRKCGKLNNDKLIVYNSVHKKAYNTIIHKNG